jgi:LysM repeat protein
MVHIVQPGDTLFSIAETYGINIADLSQANDLTAESVLHPEEELVIPISTPAGPGPLPTATPLSTDALHTVQQGETLQDIVRRYGISLQRLLEANDLASASGVAAGDTLVIPLNGDSTPPPTPAPTATPTPGEPFAAPQLLYPEQNADLGAQASVVLQWTSVGLLAEDEWYAISLRYLGRRPDGQPSEIVVYTRITSWHVPQQWAPAPDASERRFEWLVQVVRRSTLDRPPVPLSASSGLRRFRW